MLKLPSSRFKLAEFVRNVTRIKPEHGTSMEDILKPEFWGHIAMNLNPGDKVEVFPEDMAFYAELIVLKVGPGSAVVAQTLFTDFSEVNAEAASPSGSYKVEWKGNKAKFCIIRSDGQLMEQGLSTKEDAAAALGKLATKAA